MDNCKEYELVSGLVRLPDVFLGSHYRAWHKAIERQASDKGGEPSILVNWRGLLAIGEVDYNGEAVTDVTGDTVPMSLIAEAVAVHNEYMAGVLNPKN